MLAEFREFLQSVPQPYIWLVGGILSEILLQIVKRYIWQPRDWEKAKKLLAAALATFCLALIATSIEASWGELLGNWFAMFMAAVGYHEGTDKLGFKEAWQDMWDRTGVI